MKDTITIVAGFGRCGSSMLMQMLQAGGMPCAGQWPAFEPEEVNFWHLPEQTLSAEWLRNIPGHAIKLIDPHNGHIPPGDYRAIWCARNGAEQAKSAMKLLQMMGLPTGRAIRRAFEKSYIDDKPAALRVLAEAKMTSVLLVRFEDVLADPLAAAGKVADFVDAGLDVAKMAAVVRKRSPECYPGMMEIAMMEERGMV